MCVLMLSENVFVLLHMQKESKLSLSHTHSLSHSLTHTHSLSLSVYTYIYANFIKRNRRFMSTYFLLDPFEFPYYFSNGSRRKYVGIKCLLCFNKICINEEMQPKYTYFIITKYF